MLQGGDSGPSVVVGKPDESRLIQFVRHQGKAMPKDKPKLSELQIAALAQWVQLGLPWPAGQVVTEAEPIVSRRTGFTDCDGLGKARAR